MNTIHSPTRLLGALLVLVLIITGCSSPTQRLQEASRPVADTPAPVTEPTPTQEPVASDGEKPTTVPSPTEAPPPTDTPPPAEVLPPQVIDQGFGQYDREVGYAFIVENPNEGFAIENSRYQIALYDDADTIVGTNSGYIEVVLPGQTLGLGDTSFLDEGLTVARIDVQIRGRGGAVRAAARVYRREHPLQRGTFHGSRHSGGAQPVYHRAGEPVCVCGVVRSPGSHRRRRIYLPELYPG